MQRTFDAIIIGAGIIGAAIAYYASLRGLRVAVVEKDLPASGTSSNCEGNVLLSDKELGPELELARYSLGLFKGELREHAVAWELEEKGGIIVASRESSMASLERVMSAQRSHGVAAQTLDIAALRELEPHITDRAVGAALYPDDAQLQPMKAVGHFLTLAQALGATIFVETPVIDIIIERERVTGVRTPDGSLYAPNVVNAAGTWGGDIARLAHVNVPVLPRRGFVLVTEPLAPMVHHKVYAAEYIDNVGSGDAGLQSSPVVEGTPGGTILIGSSRERVGFDHTVSNEALARIASNAIELFPFLSRTKLIRHYHGFRPYCPDHLPVIGHDDRAPGLWHACGHEGAGIGLSAGTGKLISQALTGEATDLDLAPFNPARFDDAYDFDSEETPA